MRTRNYIMSLAMNKTFATDDDMCHDAICHDDNSIMCWSLTLHYHNIRVDRVNFWLRPVIHFRNFCRLIYNLLNCKFSVLQGLLYGYFIFNAESSVPWVRRFITLYSSLNFHIIVPVDSRFRKSPNVFPYLLNNWQLWTFFP